MKTIFQQQHEHNIIITSQPG